MARLGVHLQVLLDDELFLSREVRHGRALTIGPHPRCTIPTAALREPLTLLEPRSGGYSLRLAPPLSGQISVGGRRLRCARGLLLDPRPEPLLFSADDGGVFRLDEHLKLRFVIHRTHGAFRMRWPFEARLSLSLAASTAAAVLLILAMNQAPEPTHDPQLARLKTRPARLLIPRPSPPPTRAETAPARPSLPRPARVQQQQRRRKRVAAVDILPLVQSTAREERREQDRLEQAMAALEASISAVNPTGAQTAGAMDPTDKDPIIDAMTQVMTSTALPEVSPLRRPPSTRSRLTPRLVPRPPSGPTREQIRQIVARGGGAIQRCYERELISSSTAREGRVVFQWVINSAGSATKIKEKKSTIRLPSLERCISRQIQTWVFPPCPQGCTVVYPFEFFTRV